MNDELHPKHASVSKENMQPTLFDRVWWQTHAFSTPMILVLILILLIAVATIYRPLFAPAQDSGEFLQPTEAERSFFSLLATADTSILFADKLSNSDTTDIFTIPISTTQAAVPVNLTNSPDSSELYPVQAPNDERIAFVSVSRNGDRSLRVFQPGVSVIDLTYQSGNTRLGSECHISLDAPPQWSPDGGWIGFLGECIADGKSPAAVELFAARSEMPQVLKLSHDANRVSGFKWQDAQSLVFSEERQDRSSAVYLVSLTDAKPRRVVNFSLN